MEKLSNTLTIAPDRTGKRESLAQRLVLSRLEQLEHGHLEVVLSDGSRRHFGDRSIHDHATLRVHDPRCFGRLLRSADTGIGEAYMASK